MQKPMMILERITRAKEKSDLLQSDSCIVGKQTTSLKSGHIQAKPREPTNKTTLLFILVCIALNQCVSCVVVYQVRFITTKQGRTDYALAGESLELSCHYMMKDEAEDVKQLVWSKDGKNFLRWRKNKPGLEVLSYTFKGHIDPTSKHSHLTIHNVTIDMHGKYKCSVKTDLGSHEMEQDLVVISESGCKLNDWRVISRESECSELLRLDCRNMFPKPVPSCGLWNGKSDKFIRSVMVDITNEEQPPQQLQLQLQQHQHQTKQQTYRVRYDDKFELPRAHSSGAATNGNQRATSSNSSTIINSWNTDLFQYAGHLMFKCDIIVPDTSWRLSFAHRMFDYNDACHQDPLEAIDQLRHNYRRYAADRLQQAGYPHAEQSLNDYGMLVTSGLEYELLSKNGKQQVELNCWRKPRFGSLARLSCGSLQHVKLVGSSYMECQSSGWVPIERPFATSNSTSKTKNPKKAAGPAARSRPPQVMRPSRRVDGVLELDSDDSLQLETSTVTASSVQQVDLEVDQNHEERSTSDSPNQLSTEFIPSSLDNSSNELSSIQIDPTQTHLALQQQQNKDTIPKSSPSQAKMVALLPSCVSNRRHRPSKNNQLPLLEASSASSESNPNQDRKTLLANNQNDKPRYSIFNLSASSSSGSSQQQVQGIDLASRVMVLILTLTATCCLLLPHPPKWQ